MTWFQDANAEAEAAKEHNLMAIAIEGAFPSGTVRLTTWPAGLTFGGNTYTTVAGIAGIQRTPDSSRLVAETRIYEISGVDPSVIPESEIDASFGREWIEWHIWLNPVTHAVVGYERDFDGLIGPIHRVDSATPKVQVHVDHHLIVLERADNWRRTDESHQQIWPGDTGYRHTARLGAEEFAWGGFRVGVGGGGGGGGGGGRGNFNTPHRV